MNLPKWMFEGIVIAALENNYDKVDNLIDEEEYDYLRSLLFIDWLHLQTIKKGIVLPDFYESEWFVKYLIKQYNIFSTSIPDYAIGKWYKSKIVDHYYLFESITKGEKEDVIVVFEDECRICRDCNYEKMYYYLDRQLELVVDEKEIEKISNKLNKFKEQNVKSRDKFQRKINELDKVLRLI